MNLATQLQARARGVFYGWWLVGVSGFVMLVSTTPMFHAMGLWFVALESAFGWNRTQLALAFSLTRLEGGLMGPIEGYLADRVGAQRLVFVGMTILGVGLLLLGQVRALWMFYLAYLVMALGQGLGSWLPLTTMLNNWFNKHRAKAMGWSSSSSRIGSLLIIPAIAWAIDPDHERLGFRLTAAILGMVTIAIAFPVTRLIRNRPEDYGLLPDGDQPLATDDSPESVEDAYRPAAISRPQIDFTVLEALKTPAFWYISVAHGLTSMVLIAIMAHLPPLMRDQGHSIQSASYVIVVYSVVSMVFTIVGGHVGDRVPKNVAASIFVMIQASGVLVMALGTSDLRMLYLFAVLFGIGMGGRGPLTTSIRGDYFGRRSFGKIMGVSIVPMSVLLLIAPTFAGIMRDLQGDYVMAFIILAALNLIGAVLFVAARKPTPPGADRPGKVQVALRHSAESQEDDV
ncbi:MFS transporter [Dehalococcoidia bacterium]|nr:MFS transporter [Dehalococcoidia bacterium]